MKQPIPGTWTTEPSNEIRFGKLPHELIVFAQSITIILVPFIGLALYWISNEGRIMGKYRKSRVSIDEKSHLDFKRK